jgi:DNA-binding HxlR family transcriptional regulator
MKVMVPGSATETRSTTVEEDAPSHREVCCTHYHRAVELIGKRWTGAIVFVLMDGPLRFSEVKQLVPELSDRLLSERLKELEAEGIVARRVMDDSPVRVEYALTDKGRALEPVVRTLKSWAHSWL